MKVDHRADIYSLGVTLKKVRERFLPKTYMVSRILQKACQSDVSERPQTAEQLKHCLQTVQSVNALARHLPQHGLLVRLGLRHPATALFLATLLPQCIGSAINFLYNYENIVSGFSAGQHQAFAFLAKTYNPVAFGLGIFVYWMTVRNPVKILRRLVFLERKRWWCNQNQPVHCGSHPRISCRLFCC